MTGKAFQNLVLGGTPKPVMEEALGLGKGKEKTERKRTGRERTTRWHDKGSQSRNNMPADICPALLIHPPKSLMRRFL